MNTETKRELAELLGRTDAVLEPLRMNWNTPDTPVAKAEAMDCYKSDGLPWRPRGRSGAEKKADERRLNALEAAGWVRVSRRSGRVAGVRLTDRGEQTMRALIGLPGILVAIERLKELQATITRGFFYDFYRLRWVQEQDLPKIGTNDPAKLKERVLVLQLDLAPALFRGWVAHLGDSSNANFYALTETGKAALKSAPEPIDLPAQDPGDGIWEIYLSTVESTARDILNAKPQQKMNVVLPLPASFPGPAMGPAIRKIVDAMIAKDTPPGPDAVTEQTKTKPRKPRPTQKENNEC